MSLQNVKLNLSNSERKTFFENYKNSDIQYIEKPKTTTYNLLMQEWQKLLLYLDINKINNAGWNIKEDFLENNTIIPKTLIPEIAIDDSNSQIKLINTQERDITFFYDSHSVNDKIYSLCYYSGSPSRGGQYVTADYFQTAGKIEQFQLSSNFIANLTFTLSSSYYLSNKYPERNSTFLENNFFVLNNKRYYLLTSYTVLYKDGDSSQPYLRRSLILTNETQIQNNNIYSGYEYIYDTNSFIDGLTINDIGSKLLMDIVSVQQQNNYLLILVSYEDNYNTLTDKLIYKLFTINIADNSSKEPLLEIHDPNQNFVYNTQLLYLDTSEILPIYYWLEYSSSLGQYSNFKCFMRSTQGASQKSLYQDYDFVSEMNDCQYYIEEKQLYIYGQSIDDQNNKSYYMNKIGDVTSNTNTNNAFHEIATTNTSNLFAIVPYKGNLLCGIYCEESINNEAPENNNYIALILLDKNDFTNFLEINNITHTTVYWTGSQFSAYPTSSREEVNSQYFYLNAEQENIVLGCRTSNTYNFTLSYIQNKEQNIIETVEDPLAYAYVDLYHNTGKELRLGFCFNLPANSNTTNNTIRDNTGTPIYYNNFFISYSENELKDIGEETAIAYNFANNNLFDLSNFSDMPATQGIFAWEIKHWLQQDSAGEELTGLPPIQYTLSLDSSGDYVNVFIGGYYVFFNQPRIYALGNLMVGKVLKNGTRALMNFGQPKFDVGTEESPENPWEINNETYFKWYSYLNTPRKYSLFIIDLTIGNEVIPCGGSFSILDKYSEPHSGQIIVRPIQLQGSNSNILEPMYAYNLLFPIQISVSSYNDNYVKNGNDTGIIDILNPEYCCVHGGGSQLDLSQGYLLDNGKYIICKGGLGLPIVKWEPNLPASDNPFNPMV